VFTTFFVCSPLLSFFGAMFTLVFLGIIIDQYYQQKERYQQRISQGGDKMSCCGLLLVICGVLGVLTGLGVITIPDLNLSPLAHKGMTGTSAFFLIIGLMLISADQRADKQNPSGLP